VIIAILDDSSFVISALDGTTLYRERIQDEKVVDLKKLGVDDFGFALLT
jgi:hypothetical protein